MPHLPSAVQSKIDTVTCRTATSSRLEEETQDPPAGMPSLEIVFEEMKRRGEAQDAQIHALNTKAAFSFTAGSALMAALVAFTGSIIKISLEDLGPVGGLATVITVAIYGGLIFSFWQGYRVRSFVRGPDPAELMTYLHKPPQQTRLEVADAIKCTLVDNNAEIDSQANWVEWSQRLLLGEAVWIGIVVFGQLAR